jgi:hypothetical protein
MPLDLRVELFILAGIVFLALMANLFILLGSFNPDAFHRATRFLVPVMTSLRIFSFALAIKLIFELIRTFGQLARPWELWDAVEVFFGAFLVILIGELGFLSYEEETTGRKYRRWKR